MEPVIERVPWDLRSINAGCPESIQHQACSHCGATLGLTVDQLSRERKSPWAT